MTKIRFIYVVEMFEVFVPFKPAQWGPTVATSLSRKSGWAKLRDMRKRNPHDKFRLSVYRGVK